MTYRLQRNEFEIEHLDQPGSVILRWPDHMDLAGRIISGELRIALAAKIIAARRENGDR
jgi:hypothetical protein